MVFGKANKTGSIEICIAGHNPPLLIKNGNVDILKATGIPVGLFSQSEYELVTIDFQKGNSLILYTDGLTEASVNEVEYGEERLREQLIKSGNSSAKSIIDNILTDHKSFLNNSSPFDDITITVMTKN